MALMIDTVEVHIPIDPMFVRSVGDVYEIIGDVTDYALHGCSRYVRKEHDGQKVAMEIYHANESIPTSHTGIGFKFMHRSHNYLPHVILNCSIAKILQGHNVFGNLDMVSGVFEMLGIFLDTYPKFSQYLQLDNAEISRFDVTLPIQTQSKRASERARDYLRNVDFGRYRNLFVLGKKQHFNTVYFGSQDSKVGGFKFYCKGVELDGVIYKLQSKARKGCIASAKQLEIYTPQLKEYADKSVRLEATVKKRMIRDFNLPTNLWQFLQYILLNDDIFQTLFEYKTKEFLTALEGLSMNFTDDVKVYDLLHKKLTTITPTGRISTAKAKSAYGFFKLLKDDGWIEVKRTTHERTFRRNVKALVDCGFSRAWLQNLEELKRAEDTPILRILNLDFNKPNPDFYQKGVANLEYYQRFKHYLEIEKTLKKVA